MPKKKTTTRSRTSSVKVNPRKAASRRSSQATGEQIGRFVVPMIIAAVLLGVIGYLGLAGYRTATASSFFWLRQVEVRGNDRTSADDVKRVVAAGAEKPGVWNADLSDIRAKIEKFPFVKSAAVSMMLPAGIRVNVTERVPVAVVHFSYGDFLVDDEGAVLIAVGPNEKKFPVILQGWDEAKTEKAIPENIARLKIYKKMVDEWKQFDLASRVKTVNLANIREPVAVVEDSGHPITVMLAKDGFGKSLRSAIEALSGKGAKIKSVDAGGISPVIQYIEY